MPAGSGYVGIIDREEGVENEFIDFFASGHPLVEGIFAHDEEGALGRAVRFEITVGKEIDAGLVAIYKDGRAFEVLVRRGWQSRPDWPQSSGAPSSFDPLPARPRRTQDWRSMVRRLGAQLDPTRHLHGVAAIEVRSAVQSS